MNGREIEHLLSVIDESIGRGRASLKAEIISYLHDHEAEAVAELRASSKVTISTSSGNVELNLQDLEALVA